MSVSAEVAYGMADITFEVEDTGIGIPEDELDKIFAMYYQVKSGKDNLHAVGTGIGLAVSKQLIKMMGGDISVSSEEGFGSVFTVNIRVPVSDASVDEVKKRPKQQQSQRIFMVEDIELNVTVARSLLESLGHSVEIAMNGEEAIAAFDPNNFDLVLLDIQLPDMTGFDIASFYRKQYSHIPPLVALTANVMKDKKDYIQKGMDDALSKPLSVKAIQQVIEKHCLGSKEAEPVKAVVESQAPVSVDITSTILDLEMLESYVDIVGSKPVLDSIQMFEDMMPGYIDILDSNMIAKDQDGIVSEAHKIKGAAGSIGLQHIQRVAQKAQSPQMPAWWKNIEDWVEEIKNEYQHDIEVLKTWLNSRD